MNLGPSQPLTEMSTRNLPGGKGRPARKADNLTAICEPIIKKMWEPRRVTTPWAFMACYRDSFTLHTTLYINYEIFTGVKIRIVIFWLMKPCSQIGDYPEDRCSIFLKIVGNYIPHYAVSKLGRQFGPT
jgi:hypothetical protein